LPQFLSQVGFTKMTTRVLRQAKFDGRRECLRRIAAVSVHVPALPCDPILESIQGKITTQISTELFPNLRFSDHFSYRLSFGHGS